MYSSRLFVSLQAEIKNLIFNNKSTMKKILSKLCGGVLLFSLSMSLTSCEGALDDILGEWSRPTPGSSTGGAVASISIDPTLALKVGETGQLTATVDPAGTAVTWSSDKEEIATVDANGMVTAVAMGTAIITAKAGDKTATCEVTVTPGLSTPLTVEAITQGKITITFPKSGMKCVKYSTDGGVTNWPVSSNPTEIPVAAGDKVAFYGTNTSYNGTKIGGADDGGEFKCKVYGNIMSLLYEDFADRTELPADDTFNQLFKNNARLTDASGLLLPAKTLKAKCYQGMFDGCTSLTTAPAELPATTLQNYCYNGMFYGCTSLITAPKELPATTLQNYCYHYMFYGCTNLATAPALSATTLAERCCALMFENCSSLTTAPELKAETLVDRCYYEMFKGCSKLSSVTCLATTLNSNGCNNWLDGAGTDASVTSRTLHIKAGGPSTTDSDWKLDTSGDGGSNKWTAVAD